MSVKKAGWWRGLNKFLPWPVHYPFRMSRNERRFFTFWIRPARHYLEFGCGGSTFHTLKYSRAKVYSIDSDRLWLDELMTYRYIRLQERRSRWQPGYVNIGPVEHWGYPRKDADKEMFPEYSSNVFNFIQPDKIDRVLVDGRFRVACVLQTIIHCHQNPDIQIFIHDFWIRSTYHRVLDFLVEMHRVETAGIFTIRNPVDFNRVNDLYDEYKYLPY